MCCHNRTHFVNPPRGSVTQDRMRVINHERIHVTTRYRLMYFMIAVYSRFFRVYIIEIFNGGIFK